MVIPLPEKICEHSYTLGELNAMEAYADAMGDAAESFRQRFRGDPESIKFILGEILQAFTDATKSIDVRRKCYELPPCPKMK